jgi:hypothetical protein
VRPPAPGYAIPSWIFLPSPFPVKCPAAASWSSTPKRRRPLASFESGVGWRSSFIGQSLGPRSPPPSRACTWSIRPAAATAGREKESRGLAPSRWRRGLAPSRVGEEGRSGGSGEGRRSSLSHRRGIFSASRLGNRRRAPDQGEMRDGRAGAPGRRDGLLIRICSSALARRRSSAAAPRAPPPSSPWEAAFREGRAERDRRRGPARRRRRSRGGLRAGLRFEATTRCAGELRR